MRSLVFYTSLLLIIFSCNTKGKSSSPEENRDTTVVTKQSFFPVTNYLKGQLFEIKQAGINPLKYTTINGHTDSAWLKIEDIDKEAAEFLSPEIDSTNLISLFTEKNFLDQSINAFTFSYDPVVKLPDSLKLRRWDVYIDAETNKVTRIYIVKEINKSEMLQLTWQGNRYFLITTIVTDNLGNSSVKAEEKITWDF